MLHRFTLAALALAALSAAPSVGAQPLADTFVDPHAPCVLHGEASGQRLAESDLVRLPTHAVERVGAASTFIVTYTGFTAAAETAFQRAVDIWSDHLDSSVPIRVNANFAALGTGVLGSAGAATAFTSSQLPFANTVYPVALGEAILGSNINGTGADINATFSSAFPNFYFGTDGNPSNSEYDFVSIVLHELGHGLGFAGSAVIDDASGNAECTGVAGLGCFLNEGLPFIYDRFVQDAAGTQLDNSTAYPENTTTFADFLTANQSYVDAPFVVATLGGRGRTYTPGTYSRGSTYSHWNESTFSPANSNALMTPQIGQGEAYQDPGANTCAFFGDMGWPLGPDCVARIQQARSLTVSGDEGWRMLAAPDAAVTVDELLGGTHTQGFPGADAANGQPNVYFYDESLPGDETLGYRTPTAQTEALPLGRGLFAYLYADDDVSTPETEGGFPKALVATGTPATADFTWSGAGLLSYTDSGAPDDDGWNLLGNPFATALDWDDAARSGVDAAVYVYDDAISAYRSYSAGAGTLTDGVVSPFQSFWVKASAGAPSLMLPPSTGTGTFYRQGDAARVAVDLRLRAADGSPLGAAESATSVVFGTEGADGARDAFDAWALGSLAPASIMLASLVGGEALAIDHRPAAGGLHEVDLGVGVTGAEAAELVLSWDAVQAAPGTRVTLLDLATNAELDLADAGTYAFAAVGSAARVSDGLGLRRAASLDTRFRLVVDASSVVAGASGPAEVALSAPAPNPARGSASLRLTLPAPERVRAAVYDALGREVAVLWDGEASGVAELRVNAASLSAGVYIVRVAGESFASVQRLTVVR